MRTIKFRAWHNVDGWCGAFSIHQTGLIDYGSGWMTEQEANMVIEEFTGLHDKEKKEIYEGDIVECYDYPTGVDSATGEVYFARGSWRVKDTICPLADFGMAWTKVIGNIHENPELLK